MDVDLRDQPRELLTVEPISRKLLSLETDVSSLITLATIVFSMIKITSECSELKIFPETAPLHDTSMPEWN